MVLTGWHDIGTALWEDDVIAAQLRLRSHQRPATRIAFYGSSSFRAWQAMATDLDSLDVVNLGFGGSTFASGTHYFERLLLPANPAKIVLYFGENDIANDGLSAQSAFSAFLKLYGQIRQAFPQVPVFMLSTKQSPTRWLVSEVVAELNARVEAHCRAEERLSFVDVASPLIGENGFPMFRYFLPDHIHLNAAGYAQWAKVLRACPGLF